MSTPPSSSELIRDEQQLLHLFQRAEKPPDQWRIGLEAEKFGVRRSDGRPLAYEGEFGVLQVMHWLIEQHGYEPESEVPGGPVVALRKAGVSLTLEPGAQFELSAPAVADTHQVQAALSEHFEQIAPIADELGLAWLSLGFHPLARQSELDWVPKQRYAIMREYLPKRGNGALDMMRRTATVQGNFDFASERDAMQKLLVCLRIAPLVNAWLANSPYVEGKFSGTLSVRGDVWLRMEPERSGLIDQLWELPEPGYADYVAWALDAPMFLVRRDSRILDNSGQTFRDYIARGFQGEQATLQDWALHVNSLFPEARLKNTLEVRPVDSLEPSLAIAVIALFTGLLYDASSLQAATRLLAPLTARLAERSRSELVKRGLHADYGPFQGFELARELFDLASKGLERRARSVLGGDERKWLAPLEELLEARISPAGRLLQRLGPEPEPSQLIALCSEPNRP